MRRVLTYLMILLLLTLVTACGSHAESAVKASVQSVGDLPALEIAPGTSLADYDLPTQVEVTYSDGLRATVAVIWETAGASVPADSLLELNGKIEGTDLPAKLKVYVDTWAERPRPKLTADELNSEDIAAIMEEKVRDLHPEYTEGWEWSPDGQTLAYVTYRSLHLWSVGSTEPEVVEVAENTGIGGLNHPSWSHDGRYLAVGVHFSWEGQLLVISVPELQLVREAWILGRAFWSPIRNQLLVAYDSGIAPSTFINLSYTSDLVLLDAESGDRRILLKADDRTLYLAAGWAAPGQALYYVGLDYDLQLTLRVED